MRLKIIITTLFLLLAYQAGYAENTSEPAVLPVVNVVEGNYQFDTITEGNDVVHEFVLQNTGKAPLDILKVRPG